MMNCPNNIVNIYIDMNIKCYLAHRESMLARISFLAASIHWTARTANVVDIVIVDINAIIRFFFLHGELQLLKLLQASLFLDPSPPRTFLQPCKDLRVTAIKNISIFLITWGLMTQKEYLMTLPISASCTNELYFSWHASKYLTIIALSIIVLNSSRYWGIEIISKYNSLMQWKISRALCEKKD